MLLHHHSIYELRHQIIQKSPWKCLPLSDLAVDVYRFKDKVKERVRKKALALASAIFRNTLNQHDIFLIFQSLFDKILVFCSTDGLRFLSEYFNWHDTFYRASKYYYKLYVLQAWKECSMIPCAWILMNKRRIND